MSDSSSVGPVLLLARVCATHSEMWRFLAPMCANKACFSARLFKFQILHVNLHNNCFHHTTQVAGRQVVIRPLFPDDVDAYIAFGQRMLWRESWHYPMRSAHQLREIAESGGQTGGKSAVWLVLVETRHEQYEQKHYSWDEIYGECWCARCWDSASICNTVLVHQMFLSAVLQS